MDGVKTSKKSKAINMTEDKIITEAKKLYPNLVEHEKGYTFGIKGTVAIQKVPDSKSNLIRQARQAIRVRRRFLKMIRDKFKQNHLTVYSKDNSDKLSSLIETHVKTINAAKEVKVEV